MAWLRKLAIAAIGAALGITVLAVVSPASAAAPTIKAGLASAQVSGRAAVAVDAVDIPEPGMGAWTIDIAFDPAVVEAVSCTPSDEGLSVCNREYNERTVRVTGAKVGGLAGDHTVASITFDCKKEGATVLTVAISVLVDSTVGTPAPINAATSNGAVACAAAGEEPVARVTPVPGTSALPVAGSGPIAWDAWGPYAWPIAGLGGAGLTWILAGLLGMGRLASAGPNAPAAAPRAQRRARPPIVSAPRPLATTAVTLRVKQIESFSAFVDILGTLRTQSGVVDAQAVRYQDGEGVFDVTVALPLTPTSLLRVAEETLGRAVRFSEI